MKLKLFLKNFLLVFGGSALLLLAIQFLSGRACLLSGRKADRSVCAVPAARADLARLLSEAGELKAQKRFPEAVTAFEKIIEAAPDAPEAYFQLGALYFMMGLKARSEELYLKAIDRHYRNPEIYFHVGYIKESGNKLQEALEWYLKAEQGGVDNAELFFNTGNVFARLGNNDRALEYYRRAVAINPSHMDAFVNLSILSFQNGNRTDAGFYLDKAGKLGYKAPDEYLKALGQ